MLLGSKLRLFSINGKTYSDPTQCVLMQIDRKKKDNNFPIINISAYFEFPHRDPGATMHLIINDTINNIELRYLAPIMKQENRLFGRDIFLDLNSGKIIDVEDNSVIRKDIMADRDTIYAYIIICTCKIDVCPVNGATSSNLEEFVTKKNNPKDNLHFDPDYEYDAPPKEMNNDFIGCSTLQSIFHFQSIYRNSHHCENEH